MDVKIDWINTFNEFADKYVNDEKLKELLLKYFKFAKLMDQQLQPSEFANIYREVYKR